MRASVFALLFLLLVSIAAAQPLAITHVTVIDTAGATALPDSTVVVDGDRISAVGKGVVVPANATVVDGRGKYLIPGLWDMHVHLSWTTASALPVLVANGVTGVRDLGSRLAEIDDWRARINAGNLTGPHIVRVGPILNGKSFNKYQMVTGTPEETRAVARTLKFIEVDFLKTHRRMERASYFALIDEARKLGIDVVGHIPMTVAPEEALDAGQVTIEHVATLFEGTFSAALGDGNFNTAMREWRATKGDELFKRFVANHTAFDPTLVAYRPQEGVNPLSRYIAQSMLVEAARRPKQTSEELTAAKEMFAEFQEVVRQANRNGVLLLTGSDIAAERLPGFTLHDELALLVESGLTPMQALQAATVNPAMAMKRTNDFGSVTVGNVADLVLLDADPLADIHNTRRIKAVVLKGKLLRRSALDALLREGEAQAARN